eukprot:Rhum_TRINITY_DN16047_c0_g1::Rhum_TRINITY_DN16047_c0_g1_i1::g.162695::m.162695
MSQALGCTNSMQRDIVETLKAAQRIVTQFTDSVLEMFRPVEDMIRRLLAADPCLTIMVSGRGKCGKSSLINALLGDYLLECGPDDSTEPTTYFDVLIRPGISEIPLLNSATGRPLAVEAPSIREWIRAENRRQRDLQREYAQACEREALLHHQHSIAGLPRPDPKVRRGDEAAAAAAPGTEAAAGTGAANYIEP